MASRRVVLFLPCKANKCRIAETRRSQAWLATFFSLIGVILFGPLSHVVATRSVDLYFRGVTSTYSRLPAGPSPELPLHFANLVAGSVEQVHIQAGAEAGEVIISWSVVPSQDSEDVHPGGCQYVAVWESSTSPSAGRRFLCLVPDSRSQLSAFLDVEVARVAEEPKVPSRGEHALSVASPDSSTHLPGSLEFVRSAAISGLAPSTTYKFEIVGAPATFQASFTTTPRAGAKTITFGVLGDVGQTVNSQQTLSHIHGLKGEVDMLLHAGDISYADGYEPRWDSYGRISEYLFSKLAALYTGGNHEIEDGWHQFLGRFPQNYSASGSTSPLWFSAEHGPAHIIVLNPYVDFKPGSPQMQWLLRDTARVDRRVTPWVIGLFHVPWYNSNGYHFGEGDAHREVVEGVLMEAGVNVVISGHVHSYERSRPTFRGNPSACGITYLNIGDGGNREGLASAWRHPQPQYSAFREDSYGSGTLRILSPTEAQWRWHRNVDGVHTVSDSHTIVRDTSCGNQRGKAIVDVHGSVEVL